MAYTRTKAAERAIFQRVRQRDSEELAARLRADAATDAGEERAVKLAFAQIHDAHAAHEKRVAEAYERIARGLDPFPSDATS